MTKARPRNDKKNTKAKKERRLPRPYKAKAWPRNDKIKAKKKTLKAIASLRSQ